jgi:CheY-like chemotaxis protein
MSATILIIDDDKEFRATTANVLQQIGGFTVEEVPDSTRALDVIRQRKPDVVLLDIMMPKVDGLSICKTVKESADLKHIKVIVYTAKIFEVDRKNALKLGADAYLQKVIQSDKLIDTIRDVLKK